ncbi:MAG: hypothetical protein R3335_02525 [Anaerolineales bacterium]|nr:hypothetical protein [Anaerolineales bacterium]
MNRLAQSSWVLLFLVGVGMALFSIDYIIVIPGLDPADPERGWAWLTLDPEVIAYVKFWFRNFGFWVLALGILVMVIAATGYRNGDRWAWFVLLYLPVHIGIHMFLWPWTAPILAGLMAITLAGLLLPLRIFFPK